MPNQLSIPFKKTYQVDIKNAVSEFLQQHTESHPNAFRWDMNRWKSLREGATAGVVHIDRIASMLCYHAQLLSILAKLPTDIGLDISYASPFARSSDLPVTRRDLAFERAAVIFNLAALYSQLAAGEDRSNKDGVKRASAYYQNAAGTLAYLISSGIPRLHFSPDEEEIPLDFTEPFAKSLEWLMLAQAQECVWQRAVMDNYKNGLVAKLAANVASLYDSSLSTMTIAQFEIRNAFPPHWLSHLNAKRHHFQAAAQFRKSMDELDGNRYGLELARLEQAQIDAKKSYDYAKRSGVVPAVLQDIQSLLNTLQKNYTRSERDNNLIYHHEIPAASTLAPIQETSMVRSAVPAGLENPKTALGQESPLFDELLGWGAREAINIYAENIKTLLQEKIVDAVQFLNDRANETLRSLNLPASLEALERPVGLPPSLLKKAEEVRMEKGPARIGTSIEDVQKLAGYNTRLLDEAMDILDNEASEDEAAHKDVHIPVARQRSHEANRELIAQEKRYRGVLEQAAASDELVRRKWDQWEPKIRELSRDEARLVESIPSSTILPKSNTSTGFVQTQTHTRALRVLLESLDDLKRSLTQLVERAQRLAAADDIRPRIVKLAAGLERLAELKPIMFEDACDEEIGKYDKFIQGIAESEQKLDDLLAAIRARNELFLQSRRDDPSVKAREHALQSLDLAYQSYREIVRNLDEGLKFYNDLARIITEFKDACRNWSNSRKQELRSVSRTLQSMSLQDDDEQDSLSLDEYNRTDGMTSSYSLPPGPQLPSLHSDEWESVVLPPPPPPTSWR